MKEPIIERESRQLVEKIRHIMPFLKELGWAMGRSREARNTTLQQKLIALVDLKEGESTKEWVGRTEADTERLLNEAEDPKTL